MRTSLPASAITFISLFLIVPGSLLSGCSTRPLVLDPRIRPFDYASETKFASLHLISFTDETPEEERGFTQPIKKVFRDRPADVFNDVLLSSLRHSEGFEFVDRDQLSPEGGYVLRGALLTLETQHSAFTFAALPSTMEVRAVCVTRFTLEATTTGNVLIDETIRSTGGGEVVHGSSFGPCNADPHRDCERQSYDWTHGYEDSISAAVAENISLVTERILKELEKQAALGVSEHQGDSRPDAP